MGTPSPLITQAALLLSDGERLAITLERGAATLDLVALLPVELVLVDFAGAEKIADLPRRLTTSGSPDGHAPQAGDLAYYEPWGNFAMFYRPGAYAPGLVNLGTIADVERLAERGTNFTATISITEPTKGNS